jgi:hypothetical protein
VNEVRLKNKIFEGQVIRGEKIIEKQNVIDCICGNKKGLTKNVSPF